MISIFLESALILFLYASLWFIISIVKKRNDLADIAWGLGYVLLCVYHALTKTLHPVVMLCYILIGIWGIRLSKYLYLRNRNKSEDFRYAQWRREWGRSFYIRSFLQVFLLQALFLLIIISPVLFAASYKSSELSLYTAAGLLIWLIGFYWQSLGDEQLRKFIKNRKSKEEILDSGLWCYSRHPNYFGEITMWWGIYLIVFPLEWSLAFIVGPITITILIRYVSGVPMLEHRYEGNENYQEYKKRVPVLFPKLTLH